MERPMQVLGQEITDRYAIYNGDSCEVLKGLKDEIFHLHKDRTLYKPNQKMIIPEW